MVYKNILITGGCGFIGTNLIKYLLNKPAFNGIIINIDALTYASNRGYLVEEEQNKRYQFLQASINDSLLLKEILNDYKVDAVIHLAAESHVDRSIANPSNFIDTNIVGTYTLLEAIKNSRQKHLRCHHVSTDEVFGSIDKGFFDETSAYHPRSPYSASKAASDHLVMAYHYTYGLAVTMSNCSNNYGLYQHSEKFISTIIDALLNGKPVPLYGNGQQIRDWLHVTDHCRALYAILTQGRVGERYVIGGGNEWQNIDLAKYLCRLVAAETGNDEQQLLRQITFVPDRPGHDARYALDSSKISDELGWVPKVGFEEGLREIIGYSNGKKLRI